MSHLQGKKLQKWMNFKYLGLPYQSEGIFGTWKWTYGVLFHVKFTSLCHLWRRETKNLTVSSNSTHCGGSTYWDKVEHRVTTFQTTSNSLTFPVGLATLLLMSISGCFIHEQENPGNWVMVLNPGTHSGH